MKLTFLGGADEVGASSILVEISGVKLLVDAGIRISPKSSKGIESSQLPDLKAITDSGGLDYILVTHAHTDHTGALPLVCSQYPHVPVLMTPATQALVRVLQADAQRIMTSQYEEEGELPLYDEIASMHLMNAIQTVEYHRPVRLTESLQVTYLVSGHIAGAATLALESAEGTLVISGDISRTAQRTVNAAEAPRLRADVLVLESTYGGRLHANRSAEEKRLVEALQQVIERGGKALVPAFALGRAQEIIQILLAYRPGFSAPVYVDGMVRSVCQAYTTFTDILPAPMLKSAGDRHLFFRDGVRPVTSAAQRQEIVESGTPCVIVASSGMLTGGASQFYARHLLPDERNAVFLTGYQDEEAPGKALQKLLKDRTANPETAVRLGKDTVTVRSQVDTYALSAHADESELVAFAKAYRPQEVLLVHGDASARHSLAVALRQREMAVVTPSVGTVRSYDFGTRPWAVATRKGAAAKGSTLEALWEQLREHAGSYFSLRELANMWLGDPGQEPAVLTALQSPTNVFFTGDWQQRTRYRVNTPEQVARSRRQQAIMQAYPDLIGKLVVLRNSHMQPRLAVVTSAEADRFQAVAEGTRGTHFAADALVWPIAPWQEVRADEDSLRAQLARITKEARLLASQLLPLARRRAILENGVPVNPEDELPDELPEGTEPFLALAAVVLQLADDQAEWTPKGLVTRRVLEAEPLEQNAARELALGLFPPEARLRKVGLNPQRRIITLSFDFPAPARQRFASQIAELAEQSGWEVEINPVVNQQALVEAVYEILPPSVTPARTPSYYMERQEVLVNLRGEADMGAIARRYLEMTGFRLVINEGRKSAGGDDSAPTGTLMEINTAYRHIREALEPHGLYRTSLKGSTIVLSFISPQVGARHQAAIDELARITGYTLTINPNPNQQEILVQVRRVLQEAGIGISRGPGIHVATTEVRVTASAPPSAEVAQAAAGRVLEQTGYRLIFS